MPSLFHSYITYGLLGSLLVVVFILALQGLGGLKEGIGRKGLLQLSLVIPLAGLFLACLGADFSHYRPDDPGRHLQGLFAIACLAGRFAGQNWTYLLGAATALTSLQLFRSFVKIRRLVARFGFFPPGADPALDALIERLATRLGVSRPKVVVLPATGVVSFTFGVICPVIVLSRGTLELLNQDELEGVLAHELAHIKGRDAFKGWITLALRNLMFFNPLAHWAHQALRVEREMAADDLAVSVTGKPVTYAAALLKAYRLSSPVRFSLAGTSGFGWPKADLTRRIDRVLALEPPEDPMQSWIMIGMVLFVVLYFLSFVC
ncbi:MAG: M56 family metallopeptidase [Bacillota bacterium]